MINKKGVTVIRRQSDNAKKRELIGPFIAKQDATAYHRLDDLPPSEGSGVKRGSNDRRRCKLDVDNYDERHNATNGED